MTIKQSKLSRTIKNLEQALAIANELTWDADGTWNLDKANAWGVMTLKKLGLISVSTYEGKSFGMIR